MRCGLSEHRPPIANNGQLIADGLIVNEIILGLVGKLLDLPDYGDIVSEAKDPSDVELLLDFILYVSMSFRSSFFFGAMSYSL